MSYGQVVDINEDKVSIDPNGATIRGYMDEFFERVEAEQIKVDTAITELKAVVGTFNSDFEPVDVDVPTIDGPPFPEKPTWPPLDLDTDYPDGIGEAPILMPFGNMDFEYTTPTMPDEISGNFAWELTDYTSEMWSALFNKVHGDILNGGTGLTQPVYDAIVSREQEARRINQEREYIKGLSAVGSTGFNLPSGHVAAFQAEFQRDIVARDQDSLNNIIIKDFDLATENTRFAVTTGKELEQMLRATWESAQKLSLEAAKAVHDYVLAVYEANVKRYLALWEGIKIDLEALKLKIDTIAAYNEGQIKVFLGRAEAYRAEIEAIVAKNKGIVDARTGEIEAYKAEIEAINVQYMALVEEAKLAIEAAKLEVMQAIESSKIDLDGYIAETGLAEKIAEAIMSIGGQSVASTLGAINTSMTNTYSTTATKSENWGHDESLFEGWSYDGN